MKFANKYGVPPWQFEEECTGEWWARIVEFEEKTGEAWQKATSKS